MRGTPPFRKVLSHLEIELKEDVINKVIDAQQWAIEKILIILRDKIELYLADQKNRPEADQYGTGTLHYFSAAFCLMSHWEVNLDAQIDCKTRMKWFPSFQISACFASFSRTLNGLLDRILGCVFE